MKFVLAAAVAFAAHAAGAADTKEIVTTVCAGCHGEDGNSPAPTFPRLAGLQVEYLTKQLQDFMSGKRKNDVMDAIVANLKKDDVPGLAAYFAAQKPQPGQVRDEKLAAAGKVVFDDGNTATGVPACLGCHQPGAVGNERFPRLAGQYQEYTTLQMTQFKSGTRSNDRARVMRAVAQRMTEQEITSVAEYLAGL